MFESLASQNRAAGSGGGSGLRGHYQLGTSSGSGTFNALAYAVVSGTAVDVIITRVCDVRLEAILITKLTVGANNGKVRLNAGSLGTSGDALYGQPYFITASIFLDLVGVTPGTYTCQVDAAVDNVASTLNVNLAALVVSQWIA